MHTWTIHKTRQCGIPFTHHPHTAVDSERRRRCISPRLKPSLRLKMAYERSTIAFVCPFCLLALTRTIHQSQSCLLHALRAVYEKAISHRNDRLLSSPLCVHRQQIQLGWWALCPSVSPAHSEILSIFEAFSRRIRSSDKSITKSQIRRAQRI